MADAGRTRMLTVVPNLLSALRLTLAAAFPWADPGWRGPMVIAAGCSDWLDGFIARRFGAKSTSGLLLDAAADKLFALSVLLTLVATGMLQWWQMGMVIARDLAVAFVASYVALRRRWPAFRRLVPRVTGKITTCFQFALFLAVLLHVFTPLVTVVFALTAACSGLAAADYFVQFARALREDRLEAGRAAAGR